MATPVEEHARIGSIDVLRGFALLGILLLNITAFGLHSAGYFNPLVPLGETVADRELNVRVWGAVSVLFEGAMRALFSMLFGAGVVLFTAGRVNARSLHFRRNLWLLVFGLVDAFLLLWTGDILMVYALAGMILYGLRDWSPRRLVVTSAVLMVVMGVGLGAAGWGLGQWRAVDPSDPGWTEFAAEFTPTVEAYEEELAERRASYLSAFAWSAEHMVGVIGSFVLLVPDALAMMLLGMVLFKVGVLDASRSVGWYARLAVVGFGVGLVTNLWELRHALVADLDLLATFPIIVPTYHLGRLGMALGYLGLVMIMCKSGALPWLRGALGAVGRMALTNYLMHSLICLVLFTGLGFSLVGVLERWQLYPIVFAIWAFQLWVSPKWLSRHRFGPAEWLWRTATYGKRP